MAYEISLRLEPDGGLVTIPASPGPDVPYTLAVELAEDAQHGDRGGGSLHALVTTSVAGFMSAADKVALNTLVTGDPIAAAAAAQTTANAAMPKTGGTFTGAIVVQAPTLGSHPATKDYVEGLLAGLDWQESVLDKDLTAPPVSPSNGDRYYMAQPSSGLWAGHTGLAQWSTAAGAWQFIAIDKGTAFLVEDENLQYQWNGSALASLGAVISHTALLNIGTHTHAEIDTHLDITAGNPHGVTKTHVGLGNVTDDAQLKRAAADWAAITEKTVLHADDLFLIEDAENGGAKKRVKKSSLSVSIDIGTSLATGTAGSLLFVASGALAQNNSHLYWDNSATALGIGGAPSGGKLHVQHGTITTDLNSIKAEATWNNAAVTFTALKVSITSTASAAASKVVDYLVGGSSIASITKAGAMTLGASLTIGSSLLSNLTCTVGDWNGSFGWPSASKIRFGGSNTDGNLWLGNNAGNGFGLLQFGGTSSSFPAIKRSTTTLQVRLADDSAYADLRANAFVAGAAVDLTNIAGSASALSFTATTDTPSTTWSSGASSNSPSGFMRVTAGGSTRYIPYFT